VNGKKSLKKTNRFIYLISPNKVLPINFYKNLEKVFKTNKIFYFQLRLKKINKRKIFEISKKIKKLTKKYKIKFIINDDPYLAIKVGADGCHIGQKDFSIKKARIILKNKILGVTCHNSLKLVNKAVLNGANYIALGSFFPTKTKKVKFRCNLNTLKKVKKFTTIPVIAIGGINNRNYKKVLLNKANFLAISSYIWKNKLLSPEEALKKIK
tara:strand:+ start:1196 stop:1828 length:633 start_codon:yes stop_codon:yes gene_type:complete